MLTAAILVTILGAFISHWCLMENGKSLAISGESGEGIWPKLVLNVTVVIDYENGTVERHIIERLFYPHVTVFDALIAVANVSYRYYGDLVFVEGINGVFNNENNNGRYWQYWIDGEYGQVAANKCILNNCSVVEWRYVPSQF